MEILRDISMLWSFLHILVLFVLLYEPRYPKKKSMVLTLICMIPLCVLTAVMFAGLGNEIMSKLIFLMLTAPSLIFFYIMAKNRDGRFFFTFCLADTVSFEIIAATSIMDYWLGGGQFILMFILRLVSFPLLEWITWKYLRADYVEMQRNIKHGWSVAAIVSFLYYVLLALMVGYPVIINSRPDDIPAITLVFIIMPLTYIALYRVLQSQKKLHEAEEQRISGDKYAQLLRLELSAEKEYVAKAKQNRHDMRHSIGVVLAYLDAGDIDGAKAYLKEYDDAIGESALESYCENDVLNALLRLTVRRCKQANVAYRIETEIPAELPYTKVETGALFGNLFENAYEAAKQCEKPFVHITSSCRDGRLFLEIRNSVAIETVFENDLPITSKAEGGIGIKSAQGILEKHGGLIRLAQEQNVFVTQMIQPLS